MLKFLPLLVFFWYLYEDALVSDIPEKVFYDLDNVDELFEEFLAKYDKKYQGSALQQRRKQFEDNLRKMNAWNLEDSNAVFGIGPFADMDSKDLETIIGCVANATDDANTVDYVANGMVPESLDWRQQNLVTGVKDQGRCGSCYVFAAIGSIEGQHAKATGQLIPLSEQQGLDCNPSGCKGGLVVEAMQSLASQGCMKESDYQYVGQKQKCQTDPNRVVVKVSGGYQLNVGSEEGLKDALAQYGPLAIVIYVDEQMYHLRGGVFSPRACTYYGHAVLLVGYGTEGGVPYWLIKNSWGQSWNEAGFLRLVRGQKACRIGEEVYHSTIA